MMREHIHFIGIGGIGMSALARLFHAQGFRVSGSDIARSEITDALKKEGIHIYIGRQRRSHVAQSVSRVIHSIAVKATNPEISQARRGRIPVQTYAQALGQVTRDSLTISIAGAHGKSTTTALVALALIKGGLDPTVIVGTKLREFHPPAGGSNFRLGQSRYFVHEADEYRASFLNYSPDIAVVTNIDREHLDFYKNIHNIEAAFLKFLLRLKPQGVAILNRDDARLRKIGRRLAKARRDITIRWFSLRDPLAKRIARVLKIPGRHNISNALAAGAAASSLQLPASSFYNAISLYRGAWRRFQDMGELHGARVIADYAHHPTEIKATLQAAREKFPHKKIICVFQPHHYERTRDLFPEFVKAFHQCDELVLLDIYEVAGREKIAKRSRSVNSRNLAKAITSRGVTASYLSSQFLKSSLTKKLNRGDVLLMMGAGSIWEMTKKLMVNVSVKKPKSKTRRNSRH